jgi:hypothetical protein
MGGFPKRNRGPDILCVLFVRVCVCARVTLKEWAAHRPAIAPAADDDGSPHTRGAGRFGFPGHGQSSPGRDSPNVLRSIYTRGHHKS